MFISMVWRVMKPRLCTIRRSVTSSSVVQRRNHAERIAAPAATADTTAATSKTDTIMPDCARAANPRKRRPRPARRIQAHKGSNADGHKTAPFHRAAGFCRCNASFANPERTGKLQGLDPVVMYTRLLPPALPVPETCVGRRLPFASAPGNAMARLVMKFGGTSVADLDRIRNVARHVKREVDAGYDVAVVVTAMAGVTNQLVAWCREAAILHDAREYDAVVATGEEVTAGLLAIVLQDM